MCVGGVRLRMNPRPAAATTRAPHPGCGVGVLSQEVLRKQWCARWLPLVPRRAGWCAPRSQPRSLLFSEPSSVFKPCPRGQPPASPASLPFSPLPSLVSCVLYQLSFLLSCLLPCFLFFCCLSLI